MCLSILNKVVQKSGFQKHTKFPSIQKHSFSQSKLLEHSHEEEDGSRTLRILSAEDSGEGPLVSKGTTKWPVKLWTRGLPVEKEAEQQLLNVANLPFIHSHVAVMPDVHWGIGATVGSVIPTVGAIIPAAVGVDIGCGMIAVQTSLKAAQLPTNLKPIREAIERVVPVGRTDDGGKNDKGAFRKAEVPERHAQVWKKELLPAYKLIVAKHPKIGDANNITHLGSLGTGNHFIEVSLDLEDNVWFMLHSGSRGVGNKIGNYFIELAKKDLKKHIRNLPEKDLAYFSEGAEHFDDYVEAVLWAQKFAKLNRDLMMKNIIEAIRKVKGMPEFQSNLVAVNCHHNYVQRELHFGKECFVTRKGAVRAGKGDLGIIPGSMGARSYIVRGLGNPESFESCSHGAGRLMSRTKAKKLFTVADHEEATRGVECRKDAGVIDETPGAYKPIDKVIEAQKDLVEVVHTLKQVVCVKG